MSLSLWEMRGIVRDRKPNASPSLVDGFINSRIQRVLNKRSWSDVLKVEHIVLPDSYAQGSISSTGGSTQMLGTDTFWPVDDVVATTLQDPISDAPGYCEAKPSSITNISAGDYLVIENENTAVREVVTVQSVGLDTFVAYFSQAHDAGVTVKKSRFAGLQLKFMNHIFDIQAILDASTMQVSQPWGGADVVNGGYYIYKAYVTISPTARRIKFAWDPVAGQLIGVDKTVQWIQLFDPQRSSSGNPKEICQAHPGPGGIARWEVWPARVAAYMFPVMYIDGWPRLVQDTDIAPPFLNPEIFIAGASADAFSTPVVPNGGKIDPMLNPIAAQRYEAQYAETLEDAVQADEGRFETAYQNYRQLIMRASTQWIRGHAVPATWPNEW